MTVSGLHSTVTSAPARDGMAASTRMSDAGGTSDGVPPPKNTLVAAGRPGGDGPVDVGDDAPSR